MNKEQWENAARFAGLELLRFIENDIPCVRDTPDRLSQLWMPHDDWNDFGPLLVLLHHWNILQLLGRPSRLFERAAA